MALGEEEDADTLVNRLQAVARDHEVLRMKGFAALRNKPMRLVVQGVGARFRHNFDRYWGPNERRDGAMVVIGRTGLDRAAIERLIRGG